MPILKGMAKDKAREVDQGVQAAVTPNTLPLLTVEILDDVECYVDGVLVKPGETADLDFPAATNLVLLGHAKVIGSV